MERLLHPDDKDLAKKVARSTFVTRLFIIVAILVGGACLVVMLSLASDTNKVVTGVEKQQDTNTGVVTSIADLAEKIDSCTDPTGECAQRGQRNQTSAISDINKITLYAAACADRTGQQTVEEIQSCVIGKLAAEDRRKP